MSGGLDAAGVSGLLRAAHPAATAETYVRGWESWAAWAERRGAAALPAEPGDVADHLRVLAAGGRSAATVRVRRAAIGAAHRAAGLPDPGRAEEVVTEAARIASERGAPRSPTAVPPAAARRAAALAAGEGSDAGKRDAALIELLSACWLRPGEALRLDWADLRPPRRGLAAVAVRGPGGGEALAEVPPSAWRRLRNWRRAAGGPHTGPMFPRLGARDLRRIVDRRLAATGTADATPSGLRAGAAVAAFSRGASIAEVQRRGRWADARQPAAHAAAAEQAARQRPGAGTAAETATTSYLAAQAAARAALHDLHAALEALQQTAGPQQAADPASPPACPWRHPRDDTQPAR